MIDVYVWRLCNRLTDVVGEARLSVLQCYNMGHNGHGINVYGVIMTLYLGNLHACGQFYVGHLSLSHRDYFSHQHLQMKVMTFAINTIINISKRCHCPCNFGTINNLFPHMGKNAKKNLFFCYLEGLGDKHEKLTKGEIRSSWILLLNIFQNYSTAASFGHYLHIIHMQCWSMSTLCQIKVVRTLLKIIWQASRKLYLIIIFTLFSHLTENLTKC